ncbi:restriction endonuclease subunit M (plasmid) [Fulvitalea axinellae]|uniref:site-specific DNA-methyltransferase (adenine-specific) n=1 Tax=Fulvitalea axinellae TaxID=1182444 RepID=A0AAU9DJ18_9BACT|nr:restriction endonuclease subunit M [Fulvitalea axinellae]
MNQEAIKELEKELWDSADALRSNSKLTAAEYKDPLLGLVLLRFAQNRYEDAKTQVEAELPVNPRTGSKREATKEDYAGAGAILLPEKAQYDYLADLPEDVDLATAINGAMKLIEDEYSDLAGILPRNYQEFDDGLLRDLVRVFNKEAVKKAKGDVFGRIYEFFLMKFSMQGAGAQEGGEFFTPPSLVNLIVQFIEPNHGVVHDPACGSGGMFVQTAHFVEDHERKRVNETIRVYGTELKSNNTKLAKMNLAIHGIEGKVIESNSFYSDPHDLVGKCDFVMANPPFNVDKVDAKNKFLAEDKRLPFGPPLTGKGTIGNGNYLWAQYFRSYLNDRGRAGFVMASSATDAGNAEKLIRKQLIETGDVDCIVSVGNNFFYTRSLPCHVWFYDKGKPEANKDKVLMLDARNTYREVTTTINDFSPGQLTNLRCVMGMYRQDATAYAQAMGAHREYAEGILSKIKKLYGPAYRNLKETVEAEGYGISLSEAKAEALSMENVEAIYHRFSEGFAPVRKAVEDAQAAIAENEGKKLKKPETSKLNQAPKAKVTKLNRALKAYEEDAGSLHKDMAQAIKDWKALATLFPEGKYRDVEGFCKIADRAEIEEQDYSLTPGRYVGVKIDIDMDFDYKGRLREIHSDLAELNGKAEALMAKIQEVRL